jgi:Xaa-Pro aminopeptidase
MTVAGGPTPLYRDLHDAADAAYDAICGVLRHGTHPSEVVEAAGVIESGGFTIYDDLVHGYGGGYLPPILGSASRMNEPLPDMVFETGMTVVVQPNVITTDERAGVQTGGLVKITDTGVEHLQKAPRGMWRAG